MADRKRKRILKWWILPLFCAIAVIAFGALGEEKKKEMPKQQMEVKEEEKGEENMEKGKEILHTQKANGVQNEETMPVLAFSDIQNMEAGSILDTQALGAEMVQGLFYGQEISEAVLLRIQGCSYQNNDDISIDNLRYLRVLHMGFDGKTHIGELIVNQAVEEDILEIMTELYQNAYPIEKMVLIDNYSAEDEPSMSDNNSSAFNYRVISGTNKLSKHSLGLAIDLNPRYNPYVRTGENGKAIVEPANGAAYTDRTVDFPYKIDENDLSYQLFTEHGFTWGGSFHSLKDYQHFEKELP